MARAALALYEATGEAAYLAAAERLANAAQAAFGDWHGGFFTTAADATDVPLSRPRSAADNATPSGNGMMAEVLARLFHLTGEAHWRARADGGAEGVRWPSGSTGRYADPAGGGGPA